MISEPNTQPVINTSPEIQPPETPTENLSLLKNSKFLSLIKNHKIIFISLASAILLLLVGITVFFFVRKHQLTSFEPLPYEVTVAASSPKEKFQQVISENPVFSQIETASAPIVTVDEKHDDGAQTMLSIKEALSSDKSESQSVKQNIVISLDGAIVASDSAQKQDFKLKGSLLQLTQDKGNKSLADFILNGSIGNAKLDDENQDALHVSYTQTDPNNSYLKVNMSDYLLIFVNRLMNPTTPVSHQISFDTNGIWPFLGQYLHIPRSVELLRFGSELSVDDQARLKTIRDESDAVFKKTLGDINSYIDINESKQENGSTTFDGTVVSEKLAKVISDYFVGLQDIKKQHLEDFKLLCESTSANDTEKNQCLSDLSVNDVSGSTTEKIASFLNLFQFEHIKATIDDSTLVVKNLSFGVSLTNKITGGTWEIPVPFANLSLHVDSSQVSTSTENITAPKESVLLTSAGSNTDSFTDASYQEQTIQGNIYRENKQKLLSTYSDLRDVCSGLSGNEYCLKAPALWLDSVNTQGTSNGLWLTRKNLDPSDSRNTSISITQDTVNNFVEKCIYSDSPKNLYGTKMLDSKEITTVDGYKLRLSKPDDSGSNLSYIYYPLCTLRDNVYYATTPYGKINVSPGAFSFDQIVQEVQPIISSISFKNPSSDHQILIPTSVPIATPSYSFSKPVSKIPSDGGTWVLFYGTGGGDDGVCYTSSSFLEEKYQVDDKAIFVVPTGFGVCVEANSCAVCTNGKLSDPTSDLSKCANQICQ